MKQASNPTTTSNPQPFEVYQLPNGTWTWCPEGYDRTKEPFITFGKREHAEFDARIYMGWN